jgi:hypothetical protein
MPNFINNQFKSIQQQLSINNQSQHQQQPHSLNHSPNKLEAFSTQGSIVPPMFTKPSALSFINSGNENNQIENQRILLQQQQQQQQLQFQQQQQLLLQQQEIQRQQQHQQQAQQQKQQQQQSLTLTVRNIKDKRNTIPSEICFIL